MATSSLSRNIRTALTAIGAQTNVNAGSKAVIPTAKTRAALEILTSSTAESLMSEEVNLRELLNDLFSWDGKNKVNKNLIREFNTALNTEGKYAHTVELTGFLVALAPMLEPDRLARLYSAVKESDNVYSPIKYTLQLSAVAKKIFQNFSEERIERLAHSLWVSTHTGNWWDITLGVQREPIPEPVNSTEWTTAAAVKALEKGELHWSMESAEALRKSKRTANLTKFYKEYRDGLNRGEVLPAEPSLLSAYIPWLEINERPESPVFSILQILQPIMENDRYRLPKKPREFRELFPPIAAQLIYSFPLPVVFSHTESIALPEGAEAVLISDAQQLAANANFMGNCTMSYRGSMEAGNYALLRITYNDNTYNAAIQKRAGGRWSLGEINSRYNRGNVPPELRQALNVYASGLHIDENDSVIERAVIANYENRKIKLV